MGLPTFCHLFYATLGLIIDQRSFERFAAIFFRDPGRQRRGHRRDRQLFIAEDAYGAIIANLPF
jgi:hypothetical protein